MRLRRRDSGEDTELTPGLLVGRLPECALRLDDGSVSRRHARIERRGEAWWVQDLGSSNGTLRNGQREQEFELRGGDLVTFGAVAFEVVAPQPAAAPEPDFGEEIQLDEPSPAPAAASRPSAPAPAAPEPAAPAPSRQAAADQERARLRREIQESKRSRGLGDLSQQPFWVQLVVFLVGLAVVYGVVTGVRLLMGAMAPAA